MLSTADAFSLFQKVERFGLAGLFSFLLLARESIGRYNRGKAKPSAEAFSGPSFCFLLHVKQSQLMDALRADMLGLNLRVEARYDLSSRNQQSS